MVPNEEEAMMTDRGYVEKAADAGFGKVTCCKKIRCATRCAQSAQEWA